MHARADEELPQRHVGDVLVLELGKVAVEDLLHVSHLGAELRRGCPGLLQGQVVAVVPVLLADELVLELTDHVDVEFLGHDRANLVVDLAEVVRHRGTHDLLDRERRQLLQQSLRDVQGDALDTADQVPTDVVGTRTRVIGEGTARTTSGPSGVIIASSNMQSTTAREVVRRSTGVPAGRIPQSAAR